jgi:hypothetical protein
MGEGRKHPPFLGVQQIVWQSSLRGMERPVRSFKSFIRTVPPHRDPDNEKPLPSTPASQEVSSRMISSPSSPTPSIRSFSVNSWKAPAAWDDLHTPEQEIQTSSFFVLRKYDPLLPEPSPSLHDSEEQSLWPVKPTSARQSLLTSIAEQDDHMPPAPSYTPSRAVFSEMPIPEIEHTLPLASPDIDASVTQLATTIAFSPSHPEDMSGTSDLNNKQKVFSSIDIQSVEDPQAGSEHWSAQPEASDDLGLTLHLRGKNIQQLTQENPKLQTILDDVDIEDANVDEKLQKLSVSQEYHNALADQYHEPHADELYSMYSTADGFGDDISSRAALKSLSKDLGLVPRPLSWRNDPSTSSPGGSHSTKTTKGTSILNSRKRYRKVAAWMHFHQPTHPHRRSGLGEDQSESESKSAALTHKGIDPSTLIPHVKGSRSNVHQTRVAEENAMGRSSPSIPHRAASPFISPPLEQPTPLLRLPGGLALVRRSPTSTQTSQDAGSLGISTPPKTPQLSAKTHFPESNAVLPKRRPSSLYSQDSEAPVASAITLKKRLRLSLSSLHSPLFQSSISSPPSLLAHEIALPRTPTQVPRNFTSPATRTDATGDREGTDSAIDDEPHRRGLHVGIMDRARDARQAWKKHHKDAKHEKLKQSIRVIGPTDPGIAAAYGSHEGMVSEDRGAQRDRIPGYLGAGYI